MQRPEEFQVRLDKVRKLRERGIEPYAYRFDKTHTARQIKENFEELEGKEVKFAGRIITKRIMGKSLFATLRDETEDIQIYVKKGETENPFEDETGNVAKAFNRYFDIGDIIGVEGTVFKTNTGEITILVKRFRMLTKGLLPLPDKWHGVKDPELQYRQRYVHLITDREALERFRKRALLMKAVREFFEGEGFMELDTPTLQPVYGGATATPFETYSRALDTKLYLRIANELYLKRLLVGGFEKVYEIVKNFRNEGIDRTHYPEFLAMEAYAAYWDYHDMMDLAERFLNFLVRRVFGTEELEYQGRRISFELPFRRISFLDELSRVLGRDVESLSEEELRTIAQERGVKVGKDAHRWKIIDKLFDHLVGEHLINPTIVMDHPVAISPFAKKHREKEGRVERFEIYLAGMEVANAFSELNDPIEQRKRFEEQLEMRRRTGDKELPDEIDEDFLTAMEYGMPPAGGIGFGLDRIFMILLNQPSIRDVITFPQLRPKESHGEDSQE